MIVLPSRVSRIPPDGRLFTLEPLGKRSCRAWGIAHFSFLRSSSGFWDQLSSTSSSDTRNLPPRFVFHSSPPPGHPSITWAALLPADTNFNRKSDDRSATIPANLGERTASKGTLAPPHLQIEFRPSDAPWVRGTRGTTMHLMICRSSTCKHIRWPMSLGCVVEVEQTATSSGGEGGWYGWYDGVQLGRVLASYVTRCAFRSLWYRQTPRRDLM